MNTELIAFLEAQAARLTPADLTALAERLPALRERFRGLAGRESPELGEQLEFLAEIIEDCASGVDCQVPEVCRQEAAFALLYLERGGDILPDEAPEIGLVDDLALVNAVLIRHGAALRATPRGHLWTWEVRPVDFDQLLLERLHTRMARLGRGQGGHQSAA